MSAEFDDGIKQLKNLLGAKADLIITSGLYKGNFPSSLQEIENDLVGVSHPALKGIFLPALRGTELLMKVESPNGIYQASMTATRSVLNATIPLLWMQLASPLIKVQRRMFVRVPSNIQANAFFIGGVEELPEGVFFPPKEWFSVRISDISLGGIGIAVKESFLPNCLESGRYLLSMTVSDVPIFIPGKLVKILPKKEGIFEIGFAYEGLPLSAEKVMVGYIRQQELSAK